MSAWEVLEDREIFDNGIVRLHLERVRTPGGAETDWSIVDLRDGAVVLPLEDDGSVHMIRQYRPTVRRHVLELPAGRLEGDEPPVIAAARELVEEAGLSARDFESLGAIIPLDGIARHRIHLFVARGLAPRPPAREAFEEIRVERLTRSELREMIAGGEIDDGVALALFARAAFRGLLGGGG